MPLGERFRRGDVRGRDLQLVLEARDDLRLSLLHRAKPGLRDVRRIVLLRLADLGVGESRALEECVSVGPGMRQVTVMSVSLSSLRSACANESMNALLPL
jgi:hypothetical protein